MWSSKTISYCKVGLTVTQWNIKNRKKTTRSFRWIRTRRVELQTSPATAQESHSVMCFNRYLLVCLLSRTFPFTIGRRILADFGSTVYSLFSDPGLLFSDWGTQETHGITERILPSALPQLMIKYRIKRQNTTWMRPFNPPLPTVAQYLHHSWRSKARWTWPQRLNCSN